MLLWFRNVDYSISLRRPLVSIDSCVEKPISPHLEHQVALLQWGQALQIYCILKMHYQDKATSTKNVMDYVTQAHFKSVLIDFHAAQL